MKEALIEHISTIFATLDIDSPFEVYRSKMDKLPDWTNQVSITHEYLICCEQNMYKEKLQKFLGKEILQYKCHIYWFDGDEICEIDNKSSIFQEEEIGLYKTKVDCLKTNTRLPAWLDYFIFRELKAEYSPNFKHFDNNLHLTHEDNLKYLGTYFPRSYAESFCIFDNLFQNDIIKREYQDKNSLNILSVGSGTGGDIVGLITSISKHFANIRTMNILAVDGNSDAFTILLQIIEKAKQCLSKSINITPKVVVLDNLFTTDFNSDSEIFDFIISSKMINEFISKGKGRLDNSYYDFTKGVLPLLADTGFYFLLDVTTKAEHSTFNPILMNRQINSAVKDSLNYQTLLPISCNINETCCNVDCFTQKEFYVSHSKQSIDKSRVAYRIITNKLFAHKIGYPDAEYAYYIHNDKCCPYTEGKNSARDSYLLNLHVDTNNQKKFLEDETENLIIIKPQNEFMPIEKQLLKGVNIDGTI